MTQEPRYQPVAEGTFDKTPFAHILVYLYDRRMGGSLQVQDENHQATIYFREGVPAKTRTSLPGRSLSAVLRALGYVTDAQLEACAAEVATKGMLAGQVLLSMGAIDTRQLVIGLREQLLSKLVDLFSLHGAGYAFYEKLNMLAGYGPDELVEVDPYAVLLAGVRTLPYQEVHERIVGPLKGRFIALRDPEIVRRFHTDPHERSLCHELLNQPMPADSLLFDMVRDRRVVDRVLYATLITKQLVVTTEMPRPSVDVAVSRNNLDSLPPEGSKVPESPEEQARRKQIEEKAARIASENYFQMLELPVGAPMEEVRRAYFQLAKLYHPDKVKGAWAADLKETLQYIFFNISEAHATLADADSREVYERTLKGAATKKAAKELSLSEEEMVRATLEAEKLFQMAQVYIRRDELNTSLEMLDKAVKLNPKEDEYIATRAYLVGRLRSAGEDLSDLLDILRKAAGARPKSERINIYLATMLKRAGRLAEAKNYYHKVLSIAPHNIEAAREIRLMEMRSKKEEDKPKGIFSRLFRKR
jgi:curved DNA-binding protein CbpA